MRMSKKKNAKEPILEITAQGQQSISSLFEALHKRDLIMLMVRRNFVIQYVQTALGPLWLILGPLCTAIIVSVVFGEVAKVETDGVSTFPYYLVGTSLWSLFSTASTSISKTFINNYLIFNKVYFPRLVMPIASSVTAMINFLLQMAITVLILIVYSFLDVAGQTARLTMWLLLTPALTIHCAIFAIAVGLVVAGLSARLRDLAIFFPIALQLLMYVTPVLYPLPAEEGFYRSLLLLNPMTAVMHNFRYAVFQAGEFTLYGWLWSAFATVLLLIIGLRSFTNAEKIIADVA